MSQVSPRMVQVTLYARALGREGTGEATPLKNYCVPANSGSRPAAEREADSPEIYNVTHDEGIRS